MRKAFVAVATGLLLTTCSFEKSKSGGHVKVWELAEPDGLNPYTTIDAAAHAMFPVVFQKLLAQSFNGPEVLPVLASSRPEIRILGDSMVMSWRLRPEARWDNGEPVTAKDVEFSFKAIMCPGVNSQAYHSYLDFIRGFQLYADDPLKFDMLCNRVHLRAEYSAGAEVYILPRYAYDPRGLLEDFPYARIVADTALRSSVRVQDFAQAFNSAQTARDTAHIVGSGAYKLARWEPGQRLVLTRKATWWGDDIEAEGNMYFEANPERLTHEIIPDFAAAVTALKAGQVDVMRSIADDKFDALKADTPAHINLLNVPSIAFAFIAMNTRSPKLSDVRTRQALCHLLNYERGMKDVKMGYAQRTVGPVHPDAGAAYNSDLKLYDFNPARARELLALAGWHDTDNDGVLDAMIGGKKTKLELDILVNNSLKEQVALMLQSACEKVNVKIHVRMVETLDLIGRLGRHEFELAYSAWQFEQAPTDFMQILGTPGWDGGDNHTYFGSASTDSLISAINNTFDDDQRATLLRRLQQEVHEQAPYIFLWTSVAHLAISKRFSNTYPSVTYPGYWLPGFIDGGPDKAAEV